MPKSNDLAPEYLDFDVQDENDAASTDSLRALVYDLPLRPGTRR